MIAVKRVGQVKIEQVVDGRAMRVGGECCHDGEYHGEHDQVVAVDPKRPFPEFGAHSFAVFRSLVNVESGHQHGGQKHKALGGGDKSKGLIHHCR